MDETKPSSKLSSKLVLTTFISLTLLLLSILQLQASPFYSSFRNSSKKYDDDDGGLLTRKLIDSVTFLPLKDLRFAGTAMEGNTWFMSSLADTREANESEYLYFPSEASRGRLLCIRGNDTKDGSRNSYALAWPEALPEDARLMRGLTFVSDTYFDYVNLWHGLTAVAPFVGWSIKNECSRPTRWVLFHWGEFRSGIGSWLQKLLEANFGEVKLEGLRGVVEGSEDGQQPPYCFEKAVVMRHNVGSMGAEKKLRVFDQLRCKARRYCRINPADVSASSQIRLTLLLRKGSRSFKDPGAVSEIFAKECASVEGCILKVVQSEELRSFCDQVKTMSETDIVASPHGAQLTNMLFMDRGSSVMEFFPKGWLELAGIGQYAHHWMAGQSGMIHQGAWWEPLSKLECPTPENELECFFFYKDGRVGHNETHLTDWARRVLNQVRARKIDGGAKTRTGSDGCTC